MRHLRIRRLYHAGRLRSLVLEFESKSPGDSARRMTVLPWIADALAATGRFADADRLLRERLEDARNPLLDPAPIARLQLARLRVAVRAAWADPTRARRLAWQARDWMKDLPPAPAAIDARFTALGGLYDGLAAERAGALDEALALLGRAADMPQAGARLTARVRAVIDRCVARRDPTAGLERRLAEQRLFDRPDAAPRWLARILTLMDTRPLIEGLCDARPAPPSTADVHGRARAALRRLALPPGIELHRAVWRSALHRGIGRTDAARAALEPLGRASEGSPWAIARQLIALDLQPALSRTDAEDLMRWWSHPDGAVSMVARALVSRALLAAGDLPGALDAARAAVARIRWAETAPLRWHLPPAWPGRHLALDAFTAAVKAPEHAPASAEWCARVMPRLRAARKVARALDAQD